MQAVWVVHSGCSYEGGGLDGLFNTEQKAIWYAKRKVHLANQRYGRWNPRRKRQHIERAYKVSKEGQRKCKTGLFGNELINMFGNVIQITSVFPVGR